MSEPAPRARVLVVDDEDAVRNLVYKSLRDTYDVTTACDGRDALDRFEAGERFDLILSDVMMPRMTGVALYRALLEVAPEQAAKLVFFTASHLPADIEEALAEMPTAVLRKPVSVAALRQFARALIL
jgi:CheY-like chemotaxis protein